MGYPVIFRDDLYPRIEGNFKQQTVKLSEDIIDLANQLKESETSSEKVRVVSELAKILSEDAGAVTCLSNQLHEILGVSGLLPGTSAVLSMLVTKKYIDHWKIPVFNNDDAEIFKSILIKAVEKISKNYKAAMDILYKNYVDLDQLNKIKL